MKKFTKNYIGKGQKNENLNLVKVTLKVSDVMKFKHEFNGEEYITFEVSELQSPDKFGRTHTAYVTTSETVPEEVNEPAPPKPRKPGKPRASQS